MLRFIGQIFLLTALWSLAAGQMVLPYKADRGSCNQSSEYYSKRLGICCSKCKPGTRLGVSCTSDSDTICEPCPKGQFSDSMSRHENCFTCVTCREDKGLLYSTNCSADTGSSCVCKPGMFCSNFEFSQCVECRTYKLCKPGEGAIKAGSPTSDIKCAQCPSGTFSDHRSSDPCKPHSKCIGSSVLILGNSTADTVCEMAQASTVKSSILDLFTVKPTYSQGEMRKMEIMCTTTAKPSLFLSRSMMTNSSVTQNAERAVILIFSIGGGLILLFLVIVVTCLIRRSKDLKKVTDDNKVELGSSLSSTPDSQHLLPSDRKQNDTSMTSSDSHSQPESSSDLTDDCVSSPVVNLSITATFNCHLSPGMHTCSHLPPKAETLVPFCSENIPPLSQEEASTLCQQEDGKDALCSVQESGIVL